MRWIKRWWNKILIELKVRKPKPVIFTTSELEDVKTYREASLAFLKQMNACIEMNKHDRNK
jgi:hypothetical protein